MKHALAALLLAASPVVADANPVTIAPHRAVYDISLDKAAAESRLVGAEGKWVVEVKGGACTGYTVEYRFVTRLSYDGGQSDLLDTRGSSFEAGDGTAFDFSNKTFHNDKVIEDIKGIASRKTDGLDVKLQRPEDAELSLTGAALFPSQHFRKIISDARSDRRFVENIVYEGVEGAKEPFAVSAVIGLERGDQSVAGESESAISALTGKGLKRWPVSLSYFKLDAQDDAVPEWQNSFTLFENGIGHDFTFDYGEFALKANLEQLDLLQPEDCS
ncbi:MAG: DUF1849 family protein [Pseudomonadota bacterium]